MTKAKKTITHEDYIQAIRNVVSHIDPKLKRVRLVYGRGDLGVRGTTCYESWIHDDDKQSADLVEICLHGEESHRQIAGTVIHELGHVLAGPGAGHGPEWKAACFKLGLIRAVAIGTNYHDDSVFAPIVLAKLEALEKPNDGVPGAGIVGFKQGKGGCKAGQGVKGGKSRGVGSGSRNIKIGCPDLECGYVCRTTRKWIDTKGTPTCPCGKKMIEDTEAQHGGGEDPTFGD